jgi:predicted TIM-barrel fold metal-dependent hydrolase
MDRILMVSADGHAGPPVEHYRSYLESGYQAELDQLIEEDREYSSVSGRLSAFTPEQLEIVDGESAIASGGLTGAWDVDRRLQEMDREGITAELVIQGHQMHTSPFFGLQNQADGPEVRLAGVRAYHRWLADMIAASNGRLFGLAEQTPVPDLNDTLRELRWAAEHGCRAVTVPGQVTDANVPQPPLFDPFFEPFWATCAELNLALVVHVGQGFPQGMVYEGLKLRAKHVSPDNQRGIPDKKSMMEMMEGDASKASLFGLNYTQRQVFWQLMVAGVFDRYPNLKYVPTEARADWVPATLAYMDARFERGDTPLTKRPSEYWASNCFAGASFIHRTEILDRNSIGVSTLMFGRDYPHPEGTWPNTGDWLRSAFEGCTEADARAILGENAVRCYGLDRDSLLAIAAKIGPQVDEVLGAGPALDPLLVAELDRRGGLQKETEPLNEPALERLIEEDLVGAAAVR